MCVPVSPQIARRSDALGSELPRIHLRSAPSERRIAVAVAETVPYDSIVNRSRSDSPSILRGILCGPHRRCRRVQFDAMCCISLRSGAKALRAASARTCYLRRNSTDFHLVCNACAAQHCQHYVRRGSQVSPAAATLRCRP